MSEERASPRNTRRTRKRPREGLVFSRIARVLAACVISSAGLNIVWYSCLTINNEEPFLHAQTILVPPEKVEKVLLSCEMYGGPSDPAEMVYWRDIPVDNNYTSPREEKYMLFDYDMAGFNNKRISLENFLVMALAMGRTLVLPPKSRWPHFGVRTLLISESICVLKINSPPFDRARNIRRGMDSMISSTLIP